MKYRAEIDGLRALAVLPVILFHAGFEAFSGGFVGVDGGGLPPAGGFDGGGDPPAGGFGSVLGGAGGEPPDGGLGSLLGGGGDPPAADGGLGVSLGGGTP